MKKVPIVSFIFIVFLFQSCTPIYTICNVTNNDKIIYVGMKVHHEDDSEFSIKTIENSKSIIVKDKSIEKKDNSNLLKYEIKIPSKSKREPSKLINAQLYTSMHNHDSMDIRLSSGQLIFIDSDTKRVNNFKLILLPWFQKLYRFTIK